MKWRVDRLKPEAVGLSVSRRTDIPALFAKWFGRRFDEGFAEYIPLGPPRRIRRSLLPEDVTHFTFWSKWPRPFFPVLERIVAAEYPVLWNVTLTGLGSTPVEPNVPSSDRVVAAILDLGRIVPTAAIQWRYDPVFVSQRYDRRHHLESFSRLTAALSGHVDRIAISFVHPYKRQVIPDLTAYQRETGDVCADLSLDEKIEMAAELKEIAEQAGLPLTLCCSPEVREAIGAGRADCNNFDWARRVYPVLDSHRRLRARPSRTDCGCSEEYDIGVYETCVLGCRYSYGSCSEVKARGNFQKHDPDAPCLIP